MSYLDDTFLDTRDLLVALVPKLAQPETASLLWKDSCGVALNHFSSSQSIE